MGLKPQSMQPWKQSPEYRVVYKVGKIFVSCTLDKGFITTCVRNSKLKGNKISHAIENEEGWNRYLSKEKKCKPSTQVIIRETSIRTMRYSLVSVELAITQSLKVGDGEDEAQNDLVYC